MKTTEKLFFHRKSIRRKIRTLIGLLHGRVEFKAYTDSLSKVSEYVVLYGDAKVIESEISAFTYVQPKTTIYKSKIGKFCSIAEGVNIGLAEHPLHMISTSPVFYDNSQDLPLFLTERSSKYGQNTLTNIGSDVWVGQNAIIKSGVTVGTGAVIGAGSIVTRDVPPYAIYAGNPARLIRMRFTNELCKVLLDSKWWEVDHKILAEFSDLFDYPERFIESLRESGHIVIER